MESKKDKDKKKKKMSNKEIYRILAFEFRKEENVGLSIELISEMVSNLFYPNDVSGQSRESFKKLIEKAFEEYSTNKTISEEQFCKAMDSIEQYITDETTERFLLKIFRRHSRNKQEGQPNKDYLDKEDFRFLMSNYKDDNITEKDMDEIFERMSKGDKNGISFENFKKHSM